jgi:hypothetical protein
MCCARARYSLGFRALGLARVVSQPLAAQMSAFAFLVGLFLVTGSTAQTPDTGYSREQLQPLTQFRHWRERVRVHTVRARAARLAHLAARCGTARQQHRRTIDGRLCAAAFVQNRKSYTGCTDSPNPSGESGRPWCYVEAQVSAHGGARVNMLLIRWLGQVVGSQCGRGRVEFLWCACVCASVGGVVASMSCDFAAPGMSRHAFP